MQVGTLAYLSTHTQPSMSAPCRTETNSTHWIRYLQLDTNAQTPFRTNPGENLSDAKAARRFASRERLNRDTIKHCENSRLFGSCWRRSRYFIIAKTTFVYKLSSSTIPSTI